MRRFQTCSEAVSHLPGGCFRLLRRAQPEQDLDRRLTEMWGQQIAI